MFHGKLFRYSLCSVALLVLALPGEAGTKGFQVLHRFAGQPDGDNPLSTLAKDANGNLYGTTYSGGRSTACSEGCGTVFRLAPDGSERVIHSFSGSDGANPEGGIILDKASNLYSTTASGGSAGCGTIFRLAPDGTETVLYSFTNGGDSGAPTGDLAMDGQGNLYGTTSGLGNDAGSVFRLAADGTLTTLHVFDGGTDGATPLGGVIMDAQGTLYGTTLGGGSSGDGTVFKLAQDGTLTVLYAFTGGTDGAIPYADVAMDESGNLFGTTLEGSGYNCDGVGCGTIFKVAPDGAETTLYSFDSEEKGASPAAALLIGGNGDLYGTSGWAKKGCGTVFRLAPNGNMKVLHTFDCKRGGYGPRAGLLADHGQFFGTTQGGGRGPGLGYGVIFSVDR